MASETHLFHIVYGQTAVAQLSNFLKLSPDRWVGKTVPGEGAGVHRRLLLKIGPVHAAYQLQKQSSINQ